MPTKSVRIDNPTTRGTFTTRAYSVRLSPVLEGKLKALMAVCDLPATDVIRILIARGQAIHVTFDEGPVAQSWTEFLPKRAVPQTGAQEVSAE